MAGKRKQAKRWNGTVPNGSDQSFEAWYRDVFPTRQSYKKITPLRPRRQS